MGFRAIVFTDIHGAYARVDEILSTVGKFDAVILGGDLTTVGSVQEVKTALERFRRHGIPLLAIGGNMDPPEFDTACVPASQSLNGLGVLMQDVGIFGVSAAPLSPLHTPYEITEAEIYTRAERGWQQVNAARWKVFVPHAPPLNTKVDVVYSGQHVGSVSVRKFIELRQPDLVFCGHIHEARGEDMVGRTRVINCGVAARGHFVTVEFLETPRVIMQ